MPANKKVLVVNVLFWIVAALLHPLASLLPTGTGETPKVYSLLIPILFMLFALGSTAMMVRALAEPGCAAEPVTEARTVDAE